MPGLSFKGKPAWAALLKSCSHSDTSFTFNAFRLLYAAMLSVPVVQLCPTPLAKRHQYRSIQTFLAYGDGIAMTQERQYAKSRMRKDCHLCHKQ